MIRRANSIHAARALAAKTVRPRMMRAGFVQGKAPDTPDTPGVSTFNTSSALGALALVGAAILFSAPGAARAADAPAAASAPASAASATSAAKAKPAAAAPAQTTGKEIVPGLTIVFPSPPVSDDDGGWVSTATLNGSPAAYLATRVSFDADDGKDIDQLLRMAPDVFAQMSGPMMENYLNRDDPTHQREVHTEELKRSPTTAGFPGLYFSERHIVPPAQDDDPKSDGAKKPATHAFQAHGYVLFVNGTMVLLGITQRDGMKFDRKALERFVAASHFPPADNVGTLQDQLKAMGRNSTTDASPPADGGNVQPGAADNSAASKAAANGAATNGTATGNAATNGTAK